jgi:hypothetical protein
MHICRRFQYRLRPVIVLLKLWLLNFIARVFSAEVDSEASKQVRPAIVQIVFQDLSTSARRPGRTIIGSGFIVNTEGYVVTARNVINSVGLERLSESATQASG